MSDEDRDEELRWRLECLKVMLDEGKLTISDHLRPDTEASFARVRYGSDGKIDLSTVDARIRSMSLIAVFSKKRTEAKNAISLTDISAAYFDFIEGNLGFLVEEARKSGFSAQEFATRVSATQSLVESLAPQIEDFLNSLKEFWEGVADSAHYHVQDLQGSKAIYGGDLFPSYQENIASTAGLYIDTIVLSDPFWNSRHIFQQATPEKKVFYLVKHAVNVMNYRELANADLAKPIIVFAPFQSSIDEHEREFLQKIAATDTLKHGGHLFGRSFENIEEFFKFCATLQTPDSVVKALADPSRLLFDTEWSGSLEDQIKRSLGGDWAALSHNNLNAGTMVAGQCFGRMGQATDLLLKSRYLSGIPLIDAPTSWEYLNWKLEYNSAVSIKNNEHLHMVRGLQRAASTDEEWLGRIPPASLIEMRKVGAFEEIRSVLADGVAKLSQSNPENFFRSSDKIVDNIRDAFDRHSTEVAELRRKKIKFAGFDLGVMIAAGAIDIAAMVTGYPTFGAASLAVDQLVDTPKLREIPERFRTLKNAHIELKKSPMGILFKHKTVKR